MAALHELESEVTCPICKDIFKEPKKLPCDHVYCRQCLESLASRSIAADNVCCPECRTEAHIFLGVSHFPAPHRVNRLVEMYQRSLKRAKTEAETQPATCKEHKSQPLALYCETCENLVCRDCVIDSCYEKSHDFRYLKKYEADFTEKLEPVHTLRHNMAAALESLVTAQVELSKRKESKLRLVESMFNALAKLLAQERIYFTESIKKLFEESEKINAGKKKEISEALAKLDSVVESTKSFLLQPNSAFRESLTGQNQAIEDAKDLASNISPDPAVVPEIGVEMVSSEQLLELWRANSFLYKSGDPLKSHLHCHYLEIDAPVNQTASYLFDVDVQSLKRKKVSFTASLLCCRDSTAEAVAVEKITPEQYSLSFVPQKRGRHELHIMYNDTHICGSPIPVYVTIPPQQLNEAISVVEVPIDGGGIECCGGKVYVSRENDIVVLDALTGSTEKVIELPSPVNDINDILVTPEHIFATGEDQVVKMDRKGTFIKSVGGVVPDDDDGMYEVFSGIRQNQAKEIFVCNTESHKIQVFDEQLNILREFGSKGVADGCFDRPVELDFDEAGNIYVVERANHRVQVLSPEGQHIRYIGTELTQPVSITIHRNLIFVVEEEKRVFVFTLDGKSVTSFGCENSHPLSIAVDDDGYLYIVSTKITHHTQLLLYSEPWSH